MPEVDPITREEKLWSGEDIVPITREEMYIKHIFDKTQTIPSKPLTRKEILLEKAGEGGGSDITIKQLSVTENGTYSEENTAYSPVIVNVPAPPIPDNAYLLNEVEGLPKDIATFTDGASLPMPSLKVGIEPVQEGSGDPSPSNVRPISGWSEANVSNVGKNWLNYDAWKTVSIDGGNAVWENNGVTLTATRADCYTSFEGFPVNARIPIKEGQTITLSWEENTNKSGTIIIFPNGELHSSRVNANNNTAKKLSYTAVSGITFITFRFGVTNNGDTISYKNIQVEYGSDSTSFEPYVKNTYTIDLDGTRYGGTLDVVSGVLTVDRAIVTFDGSSDETISEYSASSYRYRLWVSEYRAVAESVLDTKLICSKLKTYTKNNLASDSSILYGLSPSDASSAYIIVKANGITNLADFKTWLSQNELQVVYPLATPQTYQLTPTQVKSLLGSNNVWSDTGKIEELEYFSKEV